MIEKDMIPYFRLAHGSYNIMVMILFFYQGWLGLKIMNGRKTGLQSFGAIKRHRKMGPVLSLMGAAGFFVGLFIAVSHGHIFHYPLHFSTGSVIVLCISTTFFISRKIKGQDSPWRALHFRVGILILSFYFIQAFLGLGIIL